MSYNVTNLDNALKSYVDASKDELVSNSIFSAKSTRLMKLQTGVKNQTPIVRMENSVVFQNGANCGFNASGSTVFTDRMLDPEFVKVNMSWCDKDMLKTWAAHNVSVGAGRETMPFEQKITDNLIKKIGAELEKLVWQGDKTNGTGNMALMDGFLTKMTADITSTVIPAANVIAKSTDTVYQRVIKLWNALPANVADDVIFLMNTANFRTLVSDVLNANNYHLVLDYNENYELTIPYTNIKVYGIAGLEGQDWIIATPAENLVYGVDAEDDAEVFDLWYSKDDRIFKFDCEFAAAVQYAIPENIFINK